MRSSLTPEIQVIWAKILQEESRKPKNHWFNKACQDDGIRNYNFCRLQMLQDARDPNIQSYKETRNLADCVIRRQKRLAEKKAIENIKNDKTNQRLFYKQCKLIKEGYKVRNCTMSNDNGNLIIGTQVITYFFKELFEQLLNNTQCLLVNKAASKVGPYVFEQVDSVCYHFDRRKNGELEGIYSKPNIEMFLKEKRLEWSGHVRRAGKSVIRNVQVRNLQKSDQGENLASDG